MSGSSCRRRHVGGISDDAPTGRATDPRRRVPLARESRRSGTVRCPARGCAGLGAARQATAARVRRGLVAVRRSRRPTPRSGPGPTTHDRLTATGSTPRGRGPARAERCPKARAYASGSTLRVRISASRSTCFEGILGRGAWRSPAGSKLPRSPSDLPRKQLVESRSGCRSSDFRPQTESEPSSWAEVTGSSCSTPWRMALAMTSAWSRSTPPVASCWATASASSMQSP